MVFSNWLSWMKTRAARAGRRQFVVPPLGGVLIEQAGEAGRLKAELRTSGGLSRRLSFDARRWSLNAQLAGAEVLEDRALLAAFSVSGSTLQLDLAASETVAITSAGSTYAFALTGGTWSGTDGAGATGNGLATLTATAAALSEVKVDDSGASTAVTFNNSGANAYTSSVIVTLDDAAAGTITFNGTTAFTGSAALSASTSKNIDVNSGALVSVVNGDLTFSANQQASPTDASFSGLQMDGTLTTSGSGDISLFGKGGNGGVDIGIAMSGGTVSSTAIGAGAGTVTLVGMSRGGSISFAIEAKDSSTVSSNSGNISITGTNNSSGGNNAGVYFQSGSTVRSTGEGANAANISITGTGQTGSGTGINEGVTFGGTNSGIFTVDGDVTIVGTARTTSTEGDGISIKSSAIVRSLGDGNISLTGTGTPSAATASGVLVSSGTIESTGTGAITVTGTGTTASGITLTSGTVGNLGGAVPVKLIADSMSIDGSSNILTSATGFVAIVPRTSGKNIDLGGADSAGTLGLSAVELARVQTGTLNIGDVNTATINVTANITLPATTNVNLVASSISLSGNTISAASVRQTTAGQSDIVVQQPGTTFIASGGTREFGKVLVGDTKDLVFTVSNSGFVDLTGVNVTITGADQADFSMTASPTASVVSGGSTTFTVRFTPLVAGFKNAVLHIASNDPDESSFDINLSAVAAEGFLSGVKSVGPTGDFSSIGAAISAIQTSVRSGPIVLELEPAYVSTGESFPLVFRYLGTTATDTLTIRPQAGATGLSISSADTTAATVDLNGAQFVTFDGRPGGVGTAKELTIENTSTSGVALRFINEASGNTLKFVTLQGVNTSASSGTVVFSTTTGANGNDNNTLDTCDIRDGASTPANDIYSLGSTTTAAQSNSGNTVTNCNVFNFVAGSGTDAAGVRLDGGNTDWTISGNSFYQTASRTAVSANVRAIYVNNTSGNNFTVTDNFIGGDSPGAAVTTQKWTTTSTAAAYLFQGIRLNVGTTTASSVQGNTIANIVWTSSVSGTASPGVWSGIYVQAGSANIGTVTGNTIGSGTGTGSISVTNNGTSFGIGSTSSGTVAIANNTIGSITTNGSTTSISASLVGIQVTAGANTISNNTIGSTTTANSLNAATSPTSATAQQVTGIISTSSGGATITGNTVANLNNNYAGTGIAGHIRGIVTSAGVNTITGNTVRNLTTTSANTTTTVAFTTGQSVVGIADTSTVAGQTVSQNTVHSLANTAASAAVYVTGIYFAGPTSGTNLIARNFVHSLALSSSSASSVLNGMQFAAGTFTAQNNLVRVGLDASGNSTAGASIVRGIYDNGTTAGRNFYHNSVYVGGTQTSGAANTFAFTSTGATITRDFRNNLFVNARSNSGGTGKHYAVNYGGTTANPTELTASNNLFLVSGTGGVLGLFNSADRTTLPDWQTATGVDANSLNTDPLFVLPTGTAATVDLHLQSTSPANDVAVTGLGVTNDFDGDLRSLTTPDIGADEFGVANAAPTVAHPIADQNGTEDVLFSITFAADTFADADVGDSLTYSATQADGSALPSWLSFDASTRTFSGTPSNSDVGTLSVKVTATDTGTASVSDTFDIVVANTNDAPTLANSLADQNATEDVLFSFPFAINTFADVDAGDSLTYSATQPDGSPLPSWLSFDALTRTFSGTPTNADVGTLSVKVTATDTSTASVSDTFDIVIANVNDTPTVANPLADQNATEDVLFSFTFPADTFADVDAGDSLTYSTSSLPSWLSFDAATRTFSGTPANADVGSVTITVTAKDGSNTETSDTFTIQVANVNDAPTLANTIPDQNATEDVLFSFTFAGNTFADVDAGDSLTYSTSGLPSWLSFDASTRTFSGTPLNANVGSVDITVTAKDSSNVEVSDTFRLAVANTNDAPTVANVIANRNATEDSEFSFTFALNTFADVDVGDSLAYTATRPDGSLLPSWLHFDAMTRSFSGTPTNDDAGTLSVKITATDTSTTSVSDTFDIVVANVNDTPTLANAIADQVATEGTDFSFTFAVNTFTDVDIGDSLSYSARQADGSALPSWLSFNASTRTFSGTPSSSHVGLRSLRVTATDASDVSVSDDFDLSVIGTSVVVTPTSVTITDVGGASNDAVGVAIDGDNLVVTLEGVTTEIPLAGLTELVINGGGGNDTLNLDLSDGPLPFNIVFNGGNGGFDTLNVTGFDESGEFTAYTANYSNRNDGNIEFRDGDTVLSTLIYAGLEPITIDGTPTEVVFNLPGTNDTDVRLLDIGGADGFMRLTGSTFETTDFSITAATSITINANAGNDRVTIQSVDAGYSGALIVNGGAGNDVINAAGSTIATILRGDAGNDTLTGSANDDTLSGGAGNDSLNGGGGTDTVAETASQLKLINTQLTGNGNDKLTSIERAILTGTATNNVLDASAFTLGNVTLLGGDGNDTLLGSAFTGATDDDGFNDSLDGGAGNDVVRQISPTNQTLAAGPTPSTTIATGAGSDLWLSIEGAHLLGSGNNAKMLDASAFFGAVTLEGGAGHDRLIGGSGANVLNGNAGNDSLTGGSLADMLYGGAGNDLLEGFGSGDLLKGQAGNDTLRGSTGDDRIYGEAGADRILGGDGQDLLDGGNDNDVIDGEAGHDTINGGAGTDALRGGEGDDLLNGQAGNDTILGSVGTDTLRSGSGSDRLAGGPGNDRFEASGARISFGVGDDTVVGSNNTISEVFTFDFDRLLV